VSLFSRESLRIALTRAGFINIMIRPAYKVLSLDYLIGQLASLNPVLHGVLKTTSNVLPSRMMRKWREVNIGEVLAIATNPE
jgi:hypothetical protein